MYKSMMRNIVLPEATHIVTNAPDKDPFEAWRQPFGRNDPRNNASAQRMMDAILDKKMWKCSKINEIATNIGRLKKST